MDKAQTLVNVSVTRTPADADATHQELLTRGPALKAAGHDVQFLTGTDPRSFVAVRVSNASLLHFGHPGIIVQILSSLAHVNGLC